MKAKCIKTDPLEHLEVGKIYEVKEYPRNFGVFEDGRLLMGFSKESFYQHFRPIWTEQ